MKKLIIILVALLQYCYALSQSVIHNGMDDPDKDVVYRVRPSNSAPRSPVDNPRGTYYVKVKGTDGDDWLKVYDEDGKYQGYIPFDCFKKVNDDPNIYYIPTMGKSGKYGFKDIHGKLVVPYIYYGCGYEDFLFDDFKGGLSVVRKNDYGTRGVINSKAKVVVPLIHDNISYSGGAIIAEKKGKYGVYNKNGSLIIPFIYDNLLEVTSLDCEETDTLIIAEKQEKYSLFSSDGAKLTPLIYDMMKIANSHPLLFSVKKDGKCGFLNCCGEVVIPLIYEAYTDELGSDYNLYAFNDGLCSMKKDGKIGAINVQGEMVIPFIYEDVDCFSGNLCAVKKDGKYGVIDEFGGSILPFEYEKVRIFSKDFKYIAVKKNGKWGFVDKENCLMIPYVYDDIHSIQTEDPIRIYVDKDNDSFCIDENGDRVAE